jgi:hypothetical protein
MTIELADGSAVAQHPSVSLVESALVRGTPVISEGGRLNWPEVAFASELRGRRPSLEEILLESFGDVPPGEWDNLPHDLIDRLDYYLYGADPG